MSKAVIIGGGIIGLFTAWYLQKQKVKVVVVDRGNFTDGCSFGNAGLIVPSHIIPLASPGMFKEGIKNLLKPSSPVAFKITPDPNLLRWYLRFAGASTKKHVAESIPVLKELSLLSKQLYVELKDSKEVDFQLWDKGLLMLYKSSKTGDSLRNEAEIARGAGLEVNKLSRQEIHQLEPESLPDVSGGFLYHSDNHLNPSVLMHGLKKELINQGVELIENCETEQIISLGKSAKSLITTNGEIDFDQLVITAGFWSREILKQLKVNLDVQPGKGYSFKVKTNKSIHYPALLIDDHVAVTPFGNQITQFGGGMEIGCQGMQIHKKRIDQIIKAVGKFYPSEKDINISEGKIWQGHRPCSFDGLPFIGRVKSYSNIFVGTGHSMMGVTLAPTTGLLLSEMISGKQTTLDTSPFRLER